jgi:hypothetical protein
MGHITNQTTKSWHKQWKPGLYLLKIYEHYRKEPAIMKKNNLLFIAIGISIFFLGAWGIYNFESPFLPLLLFWGSFLLTLPTGIWQQTRLEEFFATKSQPHTPIPHEPLFLARLFVALSYIARHRGILGLCESKIDKNYNNVIYHLGKNLVIDGYAPDYVKEFLENALRLMHEQINAKIHFLKQAGLCLTFVGLSGGLAGAAAYTLRCLKGSIPTGGLACLILIATMFLMRGEGGCHPSTKAGGDQAVRAEADQSKAQDNGNHAGQMNTLPQESPEIVPMQSEVDVHINSLRP